MAVIYGEPYNSIENQKFDDGVTIIRITRTAFQNAAFVPGHSALVFERCAFRKLIIENDEAIDFEDILISFSACYIEEFEIDKVVSKNISVAIMGSVINNGRIRSADLKGVHLSNNVLLSSFFVINALQIEIAFARTRIQPGSWNGVFEFVGLPNYGGIPSKQPYHIVNCKTIQYSTDLKDIDQNVNLRFHLALTYGSDIPDTRTVVKDACLTSLSVTGSPRGTVSFENIKVDSWYLSQFSPKDEVSFFNIDAPAEPGTAPKMGVHQCNLDNASFDNVRFDHFGIIALYRSKLLKTKFTSCSFPEDYSVFVPVENVHLPDIRTDNFEKDQYEMFLQLKNALEGTGNAYEAYKFQALALLSLHRIKGLSRQDKFLLCLNDLSNRHGLSIQQPFLWFLGLSIVLYICYLRSLGRFFYGGKYDPSLIGYYFSFLDLTHRSDFLVSKQEFTSWSLAIDYISKIVIGYLIYQFISAFRKYSKKSFGS